MGELPPGRDVVMFLCRRVNIKDRMWLCIDEGVRFVYLNTVICVRQYCLLAFPLSKKRHAN